MTTGEEHYPPPRHRRPLSEPPSPGEEADQTGGSSQSDWFEQQFGSHTDQEDTSEEGADTVEGPTVDYDPGHALPGPTQLPGLDDPARPRMPGGEPRRHHPETPAEYGAAANPAYDTGQHQFVQPAPQPGHHPGASTGQYAPYPQGGWPQPSGAPSRTNPLPLIGAVAALLAAAGLVGWMFSGSGDDQEVTIGGAQTGGAEAASTTDVPPLSPASLPQADEEGLVGIELALIDPYTGTGSTGSVELYLNSVTGKVCHIFEIGSLTGRYRAYIHEAEFPREGPIVVDLGEVANSVPRCVNASPIDVTRALAGSGGFYVAAHGPDREVVLRAQMSAATMAFDNRDPELLASQEAARQAAEQAQGDGLFGSADDGAYLIVDAGRVTFEGAVPDDATAERLRSAFVALSGMGVEVVDNLLVQAGAPAPSGRVIVADALLFDTGQDQISGDSPVLQTLADLMIVNPGWTMTITGHTDNVGDYLINIELSLRRANNVRSRLAELDVPAERIRVQGAGPEQPIDTNDTDEGRARNRRIEIGIDS